MKHRYFLFSDKTSGEEFVIEVLQPQGVTADACFARALRLAHENFDNPVYLREIDGATAESLGIDTY